MRPADSTLRAQTKQHAEACAPDTDCDCAVAPPQQHLSWPTTLALTLVGALACFLILNLFGA